MAPPPKKKPPQGGGGAGGFFYPHKVGAAVFVAAYCVGTLGFGKVMDTALPVVSAVSLAALAGFFAVSAYKKIKAR